MKTANTSQRRALALKALEVVNKNPAALLALSRGAPRAAVPASTDAAQLFIYGPIGDLGDGGVTAARIASELAGLEAARLDVFINSPGGDFFEGLAIHSQLKRFAASGCEVVVHIDGLAASAASFIAMAGTRITTSPRAMWMVHRASAATLGAGNAGDMRQHAEDVSELALLLEKIDRDIAALYAERKQTDVDQWLALMSAETWFTADEALEVGLTDEIETFAGAPAPASDTQAQGATAPRRGQPTQHQPQGINMNAAPKPAPAAPNLSARVDDLVDLAVPTDASVHDARRFRMDVEDALANNKPLPRFETYLPADPSRGGRMPIGNEKRGVYGGAFKSQADFLGAVRGSGLGMADPRLGVSNAAGTFGREAVGTDGGYAVPTELYAGIMALVEGDDSLLALCQRVKTSSNRLEVPVDSLAPHNTGEGIKATWESEGSTIAPSAPKLGMLGITLQRLSTLIPLSDELLEDGVGVASWLPAKVGQLFNARINEAIIRGATSPNGLLNAPALVTVPKETSQAAATINLQNILKMFAAMPAASQKRMVWVVTPAALLQLGQLVLTGGASPNLFWPQGVLGAPGNTLLGRPLIVSEAASALGTVGDIIAWDPTAYLIAEKATGLRADTSIHCYFDQHLTAFRFSLRIGGSCTWAAPVTRGDGSSTMSPIVALATRS